MVFAEYISATVENPTIVLLSRRTFPQQNQWHDHGYDDNVSKKIARLQHIKKKANVFVYQVDISDFDKLKAVFTQIRQSGAIRGVIHAAGIASGKVVNDITSADIETGLSAKLVGTMNLHHVTEQDDLDLMIFCSALSSITGEYGQAIYNSANAFLDAFAHWRSVNVGPYCSLNWDTWLEGGMASQIVHELELKEGITDQNACSILPMLFHYDNIQWLIVGSELKTRLKTNFLSKLSQSFSNSYASDLRKTIVSDKKILSEEIATLWREHLNVSQFSFSDSFTALGGDSLMALQLTAILSEKYGLTLPPHLLVEHSTVNELTDFFLKESKKTESCKPNVAELCLVKLQESPLNKKTIFLLHPVGGTVHIYTDLAKALADEMNVYGIQAQALDGVSNPNKRVADLARIYIDIIKTVQPTGGYCLGGASFGGLLAYEMAQQLHERGDTVDMLFLMDTPSHENYPHNLPTDSDIVRYMLEVGAQHKPSSLFDNYTLTEQLDYFIQHAGGLGKAVPQFNHEHLKRYLAIYKANMQAMFSYKAEPLSQHGLDIDYYRAIERDRINPQNPERGWQCLLGKRLRLIQVDGNHITMLFSSSISKITAHLKKRLKNDNPEFSIQPEYV